MPLLRRLFDARGVRRGWVGAPVLRAAREVAMTARSQWGGARANGRELQSKVLLRQKALRRRPPVVCVVICPSCSAALAEVAVGVEVWCGACRLWASSFSRKGTSS